MCCFVAPAYGTITQDGRTASALPIVNKNAIAKVIIVPNLGQRLVASCFIKFNKPPSSTKIFPNEMDGLKWLDEITKKYFAKQKKLSARNK